MPIEIETDQMRLSLIWVETNISFLGDPKPLDVPLSFLGNRDSYADMFDKAQQNKSVLMDLKAPWDKSGQHFWEYYLEGKPKLEDMPGAKAWKFLVPFRGEIPAKKVTTPSLTGETGKFLLESFFYPYGFGLVITVTIKKILSLTDAIKIAFEIKKDRKLDVEWKTGTQEQLYLNQLAEKCLDRIRQQVLGPTASSGVITAEPFTVFTILKGAGKNLNTPPAQGKEIHVLLEAVTTWPPVWKQANLPILDEKVMLPLKSSASDGATVYARKRGRAVWFPALFTDVSKVRSSLSCYHRNLVFTSLQTESLCRFATTTVQEITAMTWPSLRVMHHDCARLAVGILGRLYGGDKDTYRSMSPRYHIQQNGLEADINAVRNICAMPPLN